MSWRDLFKTSSSKKEDKLPGYFTQYPGANEDGSKQQLVMGVDFGTAFTKVVIGTSVDSYAVPFASHADKENIFLLPGNLSIDSSGNCQLGRVAGSARQVTDLKMRLLQGDRSLPCLAEISAYLALVIKHCRGWLLNEHRKVYQGKYLDWNVNVGLPTDSYHDKQLTDVYRKLVQAAWSVSVEHGPINITAISQILEQLLQDGKIAAPADAEICARQLHTDKIGLFPEFVAQVTGYVRSSMRQPDLHALVDVGAGTVDVTMFNIHEKDGEDTFPIFAKSVKPLGVHYLIRQRLEKTGNNGRSVVDVHEKPPGKKQFSQRLGLSVKQLDLIDTPFRKQVYEELVGVMRHTREKRYRISKHWESGVPLFLCGGGSKMDFYIDLVGSIEAGGPYKIRKTALPKPDRLIANKLPRDAYDRLSVAYGLSFDAFDIGAIIETSEIEDDHGNKAPSSTVCDKCGGTGEPMGHCPKCGGSGFSSG